MQAFRFQVCPEEVMIAPRIDWSKLDAEAAAVRRRLGPVVSSRPVTMREALLVVRAELALRRARRGELTVLDEVTLRGSCRCGARLVDPQEVVVRRCVDCVMALPIGYANQRRAGR